MLRKNMIRSFPVTSENIDLAEKILGPSILRSKGKATRTKPKVIMKDLVQIPKNIMERSHDFMLCFDIMYAKNQGFVTAINIAVKYWALVPIHLKKHEEYYQALDIVLRKYNKANFWITKVHCKEEFTQIMDPVSNNLWVSNDLNISK